MSFSRPRAGQTLLTGSQCYSTREEVSRRSTALSTTSRDIAGITRPQSLQHLSYIGCKSCDSMTMRYKFRGSCFSAATPGFSAQQSPLTKSKPSLWCRGDLLNCSTLFTIIRSQFGLHSKRRAQQHAPVLRDLVFLE